VPIRLLFAGNNSSQEYVWAKQGKTRKHQRRTSPISRSRMLVQCSSYATITIYHGTTKQTSGINWRGDSSLHGVILVRYCRTDCCLVPSHATNNFSLAGGMSLLTAAVTMVIAGSKTGISLHRMFLYVGLPTRFLTSLQNQFRALGCFLVAPKKSFRSQCLFSLFVV